MKTQNKSLINEVFPNIEKYINEDQVDGRVLGPIAKAEKGYSEIVAMAKDYLKEGAELTHQEYVTPSFSEGDEVVYSEEERKKIAELAQKHQEDIDKLKFEQKREMNALLATLRPKVVHNNRKAIRLTPTIKSTDIVQAQANIVTDLI